jgi:hypothetical protein
MSRGSGSPRFGLCFEWRLSFALCALRALLPANPQIRVEHVAYRLALFLCHAGEALL